MRKKVTDIKQFEGIIWLYLDQFAVSNIYDNNQEWTEIKDLITNGCKAGKIICPLTSEHLLETSGKLDEYAVGQHEFLKSISKDHFIKFEELITAQLLISRIRKNNITSNTFLYKRLNPTYSYSNNLSQIRKAKEDHNTFVRGNFLFSNQIASLQKHSSLKKEFSPSLFKAYKALRLREFISRLEELFLLGRIQIRGIQSGHVAIPNYFDLVIDFLLKRNKMQMKELKILIQYLKEYGFNEISTLDIRTTLHAYASSSLKRYTANDDIDISRIASGLQVSSIMLLDKAKKYEVVETGLDKKYDTKVFSGTKQDLSNLTELLRKI